MAFEAFLEGGDQRPRRRRRLTYVVSLAVHAVFGDRISQIPMSSIKSMIGHTMGASCGFDAAACALALDSGWVPPTINYEEPDPTCDLDYVPNVPRDLPDLKVAMSNSFGFGGHNASLVVRRWEG